MRAGLRARRVYAAVSPRKVARRQCFVGERNYHCFYQLITATQRRHRSRPWRRRLGFAYLRRTKVTTIASVDDASDFRAMIAAADAIKLSSDETESIWRSLAGVLHPATLLSMARKVSLPRCGGDIE